MRACAKLPTGISGGRTEEELGDKTV